MVYIHVKSGIGELQFTTIYIYTCGTSAESTSARVEVIAAVVLALLVGALIGFLRFKGTTPSSLRL
jgi:hypothetical protein